MVAPVASTAAMAMLAMSQKPDRVSNILRSSTETTRLSGMGRIGGSGSISWARRISAGSRATALVALMPRHSLGVCGELRNSSSAGRRRPCAAPRARPRRRGRSCRPVRARRWCAGPSPRTRLAVAGWGQDELGLAEETRTNVPACCSSALLVPWDTIRPLPITTRSSAMTSISCSRCDDSSTVPPRSAYSRSRSRIQRMPAGSRPLAGSSRISTWGSPIRAVAIPSRWRMPSE